MSGIFGHDGYLYQSIVVVNLILEHLQDSGGLSEFYVEVDKDDYSVDCIIVDRNKNNVYFYEVKGGQFSVNDSLKKLNKCETSFKKLKLLSDKIISYSHIVYKFENQISKKIKKDFKDKLLQRPNNISARSSFHSWGSLELESLEKCRELIRLIIPEFDSDRQKRMVYLFFKSIIDHIIQHKAEDIRLNGYGFTSIRIKDYLSTYPDCFSELIAEFYPAKFRCGLDVYKQLNNKLANKKSSNNQHFNMVMKET